MDNGYNNSIRNESGMNMWMVGGNNMNNMNNINNMNMNMDMNQMNSTNMNQGNNMMVNQQANMMNMNQGMFNNGMQDMGNQGFNNGMTNIGNMGNMDPRMNMNNSGGRSSGMYRDLARGQGHSSGSKSLSPRRGKAFSRGSTRGNVKDRLGFKSNISVDPTELNNVDVNEEDY